jgi:hypothetical protein
MNEKVREIVKRLAPKSADDLGGGEAITAIQPIVH